MKRLCMTLLVLAGFAIYSSAQSFQYGNLLFSVISTEPPCVRVDGHTDGTNAQGEIVIPETVNYDGNNYTVIEIGKESFYGCSKLIGNLVIPDPVTKIGEWAFGGCRNLDGVLVLSRSLKVISCGAFSGCEGLCGTLDIPESVDSIDFQAFYHCKSFTGDLVIPNSVKSLGFSYDSLGQWVYDGTFEQCTGFNGRLILPESLQIIPEHCFKRCNGFYGELTLPQSLTSICQSAFEYCSGFTGDLVIPESVNIIGNAAFCDCKGFDGTLRLPSEMAEIGASAFASCENLEGRLVLPTGPTNIFEYSFCNCGFSGDIVIPNTVQRIDNNAFGNCHGITGVVLDKALEVLWFDAFQNTGLLSMTVQTEIPPMVFAGNWVWLYGNDIPVTVPCGTLETYRYADGWNSIPILLEGNTHLFSVTMEFEYAGNVYILKEPSCEDPTVEVEAVPNEGYFFLYWEANGEQVSSENSYSFELVEDTELVAHFSGTGVNEREVSFSVFPNPTNGQVTITGENLRKAEVVNMLGQQVAIAKGKGETLQVDISDLPVGIYFVNVTDEEGRKCVRKVVKE